MTIGIDEIAEIVQQTDDEILTDVLMKCDKTDLVIIIKVLIAINKR